MTWPTIEPKASLSKRDPIDLFLEIMRIVIMGGLVSDAMTTLFNQIVGVVVLLVSTVIVVHRIGEDEHLIDENVAVSRHDDQRNSSVVPPMLG